MNNKTRILLNNVSKKFKIGYEKKQNTLRRVISLISGKEFRREFWVLKNISIDIKSGEIVGIIGKNGSGKSTLLRTIAGIYKPDRGYFKLNGKLIPLIQVNEINSRLSMKDSIYLFCSLFGLNLKDIKKRMNSIVEFAELNGFTNTKLYQFSSGMRDRLSFSISVHCDPDILLIDEIFGYSDIYFKNKFMKKLKEMAKDGKTILFVSQDMEFVKTNCDRVIWLDNGKIVLDGSIHLIDKYFKDKLNKNPK